MGGQRAAFEQLLYSRLIPEFCGEAERLCNPSAFNAASVRVSEEDARYFLMAYNAGLIQHVGRGQYQTGSSAKEQFFWEGRRALEPRPFTLWLEPVLTVAGLGRLHFDHGWPKHLIGTQSVDWAFDLVSFLPGRSSEFIAGEVKKTAKEIHELLRLMKWFCGDPTIEAPVSGKERNAYKKVLALRSRQAPIFWAVGPEGLSQVFGAEYLAGGVIDLVPVENDALAFPTDAGVLAPLDG